MSVFAKQTLLKISAETGIDLTSATEKKILYQDPTGQKGSWDATVNGTLLEYNLQAGDIPVTGIWRFQSYVVVGGRKAYGEIVENDFKKPLD